MADTFNVEFITPDRTVYKGEAKALVLPAEGGSLGILPNHAPLVAALEVGAARVDPAHGESTYLMIGEGFVEVRDNDVKILAQLGERDDEIDLARAEEAEKRALERLRERASQEVDFNRAKAALTRASTRLRILRDLAPSKSRGRADQPRV